ncbi:hypothetical protein SEA_AEGEUS_142 [Mycobacterium phage Aegeus]|nr:hypothetical protein SEA_BAUDELAIRE_142 [Mycobacterium phage Baudelaire]WKW86616.1 hypothetical protein SEA_AEGEUS_142 [Mycobacterium phage Aegeus]
MSEQIEALIVNVDGTVTPTQIDNMGARDLQKIVGGYIEAINIYTPRGEVTLWGHDEAKIIRLPINKGATLIWWKLNPEMAEQDVLAGPIVITGGADADGACLPVPEWIQEIVEANTIAVVVRDKE